jgi:hypothetical protein
MERAESQAEPVTREAIELPRTSAPLRPMSLPLAGNGCCAPTELEVCCTADAKEECCGAATSEGCGCR